MSYEDLEAAAASIAETTGRARHSTVVILGSGLGAYPQTLAGAKAVPYRHIPGFPVPQVSGHAGTLYSAQMGETVVLLLAGRAHAYEGHSMEAVVFAVRSCILAGCRRVVLTNAAGGCRDGLAPGDLVLITDHLNLSGRNPLVGPNDDRLGPRFPDQSYVYTPSLRALALEVGRKVGVTLKEGVYAWLLGPTYETPAEIRMLRTLGADLVGMSTVPEAIAARHMGADILGISLVTNLAAGLSPARLAHEEVQETANQASNRFTRLLNALLPRL
ncbi:MAG TPA: purine-nucleoside phosphorylase [Acidimicrobiia bacterium]|nr:purine-nucleoside phosphorylase [Acidimicrobiia bacterium]